MCFCITIYHHRKKSSKCLLEMHLFVFCLINKKRSLKLFFGIFLKITPHSIVHAVTSHTYLRVQITHNKKLIVKHLPTVGRIECKVVRHIKIQVSMWLSEIWYYLVRRYLRCCITNVRISLFFT